MSFFLFPGQINFHITILHHLHTSHLLVQLQTKSNQVSLRSVLSGFHILWVTTSLALGKMPALLAQLLGMTLFPLHEVIVNLPAVGQKWVLSGFFSQALN